MAMNNTMHEGIYFRVSRKYFNMIEVTLAIGIVALGMVGILSLFPVGFQSTRDAMGDNYVNDASQLFLSYIKLLTKKDTTYPAPQTQNDIDIRWNSALGAIPIANNISESTEKAATFTVSTVPNLYTCGTYGLYHIYSGKNDFKAAVRIWKTPVTSPVKISGAWTHSSADFSKSCGLNIEFSWPVEKPYAQRMKRYFYYEIYKTQL